MQILRPSDQRGHANFGWLDSRHTFSFGHYYDAQHMGFGSLRVINEDRVSPGAGFETHGHRDMEIITYVLHGALEHGDSLGNGSVIRPGEVQLMSAGTGIRHSEFNHSKADPVHLLQIWITPDQKGYPPSYEQKRFPENGRRGSWQLLVSPDGRDDSLTIHQDADLYATRLKSGEAVTFELRQARQAWIQVTRGAASLNGHTLHVGDGIGVAAPADLNVTAADDAEILLFDLASS